MPPPLQVVTWTATQLSAWRSRYINRSLNVNLPVKHTGCAAPKILPPGKCLTSLTSKWVTRVMNFLQPSFLPPFILGLGVRHWTDVRPPSVLNAPTIWGEEGIKGNVQGCVWRWKVTGKNVFTASCAGGRHNMPAPPASWLLTLKVVSESRAMWTTSVLILVFLGLSILDFLDVRDRHIVVRRASSLNAPYPRSGA